MKLVGSNEELFAIIVSSLLQWDDKMQSQCAQSFIEPLQLGLFTEPSKVKIVQKAILVVQEHSSPDNECYLLPWIEVFRVIAPLVQLKVIQDDVIPCLKELLSSQSSIELRKVGNLILFSILQEVGEEAMDREPQLPRLMQSVFHDNNYKLRRAGVLFLKEYFAKYQAAGKVQEIVDSPRFKDMYLLELLDFIQDEDLHI